MVQLQRRSIIIITFAIVYATLEESYLCNHLEAAIGIHAVKILCPCRAYLAQKDYKNTVLMISEDVCVHVRSLAKQNT